MSLILKRYAQDSMCDLELYRNFGLSCEADFYDSIATMAAEERRVIEEMFPQIYILR